MGWIGVDFDGTLAMHPDPENPWPKCGRPIEKMVSMVRQWLTEGTEVRVVTARAASREHVRRVEDWCLWHLDQVLPVTDRKDFEMIALYDDRAVQVVPNKGELVQDYAPRELWEE